MARYTIQDSVQLSWIALRATCGNDPDRLRDSYQLSPIEATDPREREAILKAESSKVTVTKAEKRPQPGVRVHWLSNGWFVREDPRKGSYSYKLHQPGQAKENDPKLLKTSNKLRQILKFANSADGA